MERVRFYLSTLISSCDTKTTSFVLPTAPLKALLDTLYNDIVLKFQNLSE